MAKTTKGQPPRKTAPMREKRPKPPAVQIKRNGKPAGTTPLDQRHPVKPGTKTPRGVIS